MKLPVLFLLLLSRANNNNDERCYNGKFRGPKDITCLFTVINIKMRIDQEGILSVNRIALQIRLKERSLNLRLEWGQGRERNGLNRESGD